MHDQVAYSVLSVAMLLKWRRKHLLEVVGSLPTGDTASPYAPKTFNFLDWNIIIEPLSTLESLSYFVFVGEKIFLSSIIVKCRLFSLCAK